MQNSDEHREERVVPADCGPRRNRVLVIDDELGPRENLRILLKNRHEVICADSVDRGIQAMRQNPVDVIILDIKMPEKSGIDGLQEVRALDPDVSVIMLTGYASVETAQKAIRLGANDYMKKPFDTREVSSLVDRCAERTHMVRQRAQTVRELEGLNRRLRADLDEKEHFATLGEASAEFVHDLRSPLTVIQGYIDLLVGELKEQADHSKNLSNHEALSCLEAVRRSAKRCEEMSQQWRDLARRDESRMRLLDLRDVLREAGECCRPLAERTGADFVVDSGEDACMVRADSVLLYRALQNVISNAVRALPDRGGFIRLSCRRVDGAAEVVVEDNGCGIAPDQVDRLFSPPAQGGRRNGGPGLGLFITRKVIDLHRGTTAISSSPGAGTVVKLSLPLFAADVANVEAVA